MRKAGILVHPTSLPGPGPCGDFGKASLRYLEWLEAAGISLWQTLPMHPTGGGFSPYSSPSAFAGATHLISLDGLVEKGLLSHADLYGRPSDGRFIPKAITNWKEPLIRRAARRLAANDPMGNLAFSQKRPWVHDWALFQALQRHFGLTGWQNFPPQLRDRSPEAIERATQSRKSEISEEIGLQRIFFDQWNNLRNQAKERGIEIVGDMPIFIAGDGCDAWVNRELFRLDDAGNPDPVAGAPPDAFSNKGQHWGNPLYEWERHKKTGYKWWISRIKSELEFGDWVRIDHFRGFCAAWEIPLSARGDARLGNWTPAPGKDLFSTLKEEFGKLPFIAEDLGHITPDVEKLRDEFGFSGMRILQFAFGDFTHIYLPHNYKKENWVCYTGTHDNDTSIGWYQRADDATRHRYRVYVGRSGSEPNWDLIRLAWSSVAKWSFTTLQDVLGLGSEGRMNTPGLADGNWTWRASGLPEGLAMRLRQINETYGRLSEQKSPFTAQ